MLKRDYLLKMLQEFMSGISQLLDSDKGEQEKEQDLDYFYTHYLNQKRDYFINLPLEELNNYLSQFTEQELAYRLALIAEVLYHDTVLTKDPLLKRNLAIKSAYSYEQLTLVDHTYSLERQNRIAQLNRWAKKELKPQ